METLPVGIDVSLYGPPEPVEPPHLLIVGAFDWRPNADGAIRFLSEAWPRLAEDFPHWTLRIAGKNPPPELRTAAREPRVQVTGYVDDMRAEFRRASALIVPLWVGAGARVKIIEALASGLPVASTELGAAGLELVPERDCLLARDVAGLGEAAARLMRDSALRQRLSARGREVAVSRWSLEAMAELQNRLCMEAVAGSQSSP